MTVPDSTVEEQRIVSRLDPFGYWPAFSSKIRGLGGHEPPSVANYAFHTPYALCGAGTATFSLRFSCLSARQGRLTIRVHRVPANQDTAKPLLVKVLGLSSLTAETTFRVTAAEGDRLALVGLIYDETDAIADGLEVMIDHRSAAAPYREKLHSARQAIFGDQDAPPRAEARLSNPQSQTCTAAQFEEPVYDEWLRRLRISKQRHRKQWEFVYILQSLERYGKLRSGNRGVGFGVGVEYLPAYMACVGCEVLGTDLAQEDQRSAAWHAGNQHGAGLDNLFYPELCDEETFLSKVSYRAVDMNDVPDDISGFDFTWSSCAFEHLGSIEAGLSFVERSLDTLNDGGIAVHTSELNLTSNDATVGAGDTVLFRRQDYERLAERLRAQGHDVAPLVFDHGALADDDFIDLPPYSNDPHLKLLLGQYVTTSFGLIIKKHAQLDQL